MATLGAAASGMRKYPGRRGGRPAKGHKPVSTGADGEQWVGASVISIDHTLTTWARRKTSPARARARTASPFGATT